MEIKKIKEKIISELKKEELFDVWKKIEVPIIDYIDEMNKNGFKINLDEMKKKSQDFNQKIKKLEEEIFNLAGKEFNIKSSQQLSKILFEVLELPKKGIRKTASGYFSTKESELEKLKEEHEIIPKILEYRELTKMVSTYIDNLIPEIEKDKDHRLHYEILQIGTSTGRMSSKNPNIQNIPAGGEFGQEIRKFFIAKKNHSLVSFDYSQIELRIVAIFSQDKFLLEAFQNGLDIHSIVAEKVFGEANPENRKKAKVINFGILYGMGVNSLAKNLNTDRKTAQEYLNQYFETFQGLKEYIEKIKEFGHQNGWVKTLYGRKRFLPELNSKLPFIRSNGERMAINAPIQGTSADIIKLAMQKIWDFLKNKNLLKKIKPIAQIHDELIFEISDEILTEKYLTEIESFMENIFQKFPILDEYKNLKLVPLKVNKKIAKNWAELK